MTTGPFLDFLVAVVALVLMLQSHRLIRSFLDHLIPYGGGGRSGPGALLSGLMEGIGIGMGEKFLGAGVNAMKATAGLAASAGIAGLAGARAFLKQASLKKHLPKITGRDDSAVKSSSPGNVFESLTGGNDAALGLPSPEAEAWTMFDPFTSQTHRGPGIARVLNTTGTAGTTGASTTEAGAAGSEPRKGRNTTGFGSSDAPLFDHASRVHGAHTRLMPSSMEKLAALEQRPTYRNAANAFLGEARRRLKQDLHHKATSFHLGHRSSGYAGAHNILGVAMQEFGDRSAESKLYHDSTLPSVELLRAAAEGGPNSDAAEDLTRIGQYQSELEQGMRWMMEGDEQQQRLSPSYESAKAAYEFAEDEVNVAAARLDEARQAKHEGTPMFAQLQAEYEHAIRRRDEAKDRYLPLKAQMERARNLSQRGEKRVVDAQNSISRINWKYYKNPSQSMMQQARVRANRVGLSDLSSPWGGRRAR
ncbi:hypothetical protein [Alicyclobacillus macrosporangiidus]|uniref:Uncharacterized protein n=1 Tax=Alicyclobacillus macrosporangiidus TaxID=392015 RepID=A0A1I7KCP9_9BACL|nr:hypothetical protein [Alicyclobacillus macrosporangiidus]SFU95241.1 hypothetical protein SAMN05421543_11537 [Alicyclobacillus macrosporangiidus]